MRRVVVGIVAGLALALGPLRIAGAETPQQRPDQLAFNARVTPGSVLVVAETPNGDSTSSPLCTDIPSLKSLWAQEMSGRDATDPNCTGVPSGSRVQVLRKTLAYAVDDPSQPIEPYGNDAHLIVEAQVVTVASSASDTRSRVGRRGYMLVDDLVWPPSK